jgi:hypothetical protein
MRLFAVLATIGCLAACSSTQTQSEQALAGKDEEIRQRLVILDAAAILQGMQQARERAQQLARTAR